MMAAEVAHYSSVTGYPRKSRESMSSSSSFSYVSRPRKLYYDSYKNMTEKPLHGNIMYDKRVIRGNTWALRRMATDALSKASMEERRVMHERRHLVRQRVQAKLRNERRKKTDTSGTSSVAPTPTSITSISIRKRRQLTPPPRSPTMTRVSPTPTTRRSSIIVEEDTNMGEKPGTVSSSGDSGIAVGDAVSARSVGMDDDGKAAQPTQPDTPTVKIEADVHQLDDQSCQIMDQSEMDEYNHQNDEVELVDNEMRTKSEDDQILDNSGLKQSQEMEEPLQMIQSGYETVENGDASQEHAEISTNLEYEAKEPNVYVVKSESPFEETGVEEGDLKEEEDAPLQDEKMKQDISDLHEESTAMIQTFTVQSLEHLIALNPLQSDSQSETQPYDDPPQSDKSNLAIENNQNNIQDTDDSSDNEDMCMFDTAIPSSAQTLVCELLDGSIKRVASVVDDEYQPITDSNQPIDSCADIEKLDENDETSMIDSLSYSRSVIDQLLDQSVQNVTSVDSPSLITKLAKNVLDNVLEVSLNHLAYLTIRELVNSSKESVDDWLETAVQRLVDISLMNATDHLTNEERMKRLERQQTEQEWHEELKKLEETVLLYGHHMAEEKGEHKCRGRKENEPVWSANEDGKTGLDSKVFTGMNLIREEEKAMELPNYGQLKEVESSGVEFMEEMHKLKLELEEERQEKEHLVHQLTIVMDETNRYACRSIAQEKLSSMFHHAMDGVEMMKSEEGKCEKCTDGHCSEEEPTNRIAFIKENTLLTSSITYDGMDLEQETMENDSMEEILNEVSKEVVPWICGRAYGEVARGMTNVWLRDGTGGRSQYCRCSAQRPLRRLLQEIEELQHFS